MWMWLIGQEEWRNKSLIYSLLGSRYVARVCWSRPVIGWQLLPSNSTQITDGFGVGHGHRDIWQLLCFRCMQAITTDTVIAYIIPTTTGPVYYQRQAGTERSDVAACASVKANRIPYYSSVGGCSSHFRARDGVRNAEPVQYVRPTVTFPATQPERHFSRYQLRVQGHWPTAWWQSTRNWRKWKKHSQCTLTSLFCELEHRFSPPASVCVIYPPSRKPRPALHLLT